MAFLHGIEHLDVPSDLVAVNDVPTAVIGLIGTASGSTIEVNKLYLCSNEKDDAKFGAFGTIPEVLKAIRLQKSKRGSALVFVICIGTPLRPGVGQGRTAGDRECE